MMANQAGVSIRNLPRPIAAPKSSFIVVLDSIPMAMASAATGIATCPSALFAMETVRTSTSVSPRQPTTSALTDSVSRQMVEGINV